MIDRPISAVRPPTVWTLMTWCIVAVIFAVAAPARAEGEAAAWDALRQGGHVAIMRHALAPGTGDPAAFALEDCGTQRNLSPAGREQARKVGAAFRANNVAVERVYSSQWCRALETARLLDLGEVEELAALNSFFARPERRDAQMAALWDWLVENRSEGTKVLVTHQVVISALTGGWTREGEVVVFRVSGDETLTEAGRIPPPP
jgi:phosphohistidine phosphatase SixA